MFDINNVYVGDCLTLIKNIEDKSINISFTSSPYNRIRDDTYDYYHDTRTDYYDMLVAITDEMLRVTKGYVIVNIQCNRFNKKEFYSYIGHYADKINGTVIWVKSNPQPAGNYKESENTRSVTNAFEYFIFIKDGENFVKYGDTQFNNVITSTVNSKHIDGHGAIMKKEVCYELLKHFTNRGDVILDPFFGTGTTGVCALELERNFIGFEIVPEYADVARQRISCVISGIDEDKVSFKVSKKSNMKSLF